MLGGLAYAYGTMGDKEKALEYYDQALEIYEAVNDVWGVAEAEMSIGEIHYSLSDHERALGHFHQALTSFRRIRMPRQEAKTLRDIGLVHDSLGDENKALGFYQQSLALTLSGQDQRYEAYTLNYIGRVYERRGETQKARGYYQRALSLNQEAGDPAGESLTLYNFAHLERDLGHLDEALDRIGASLEISESLRAKVASQDVRAAYVASAHQFFELNIDVLMRLAKQRQGAGFVARAFEVSERAHARSLLESLKEARADIRQGADPALLEKERQLEHQLNIKAQRHAEILASNKKEEAELVDKDIRQLTEQYEETRAQIRTTSPRYAALTQPQPLTLAQIQKEVLRDDDSLLLEYMLGDERSYVWAVSRTEVSGYELPGRAEIEKTARSVYALLTSNQPKPGESFEQTRERAANAGEQLPPQIAALSRLLVWPLASKLGTKRLLVVPDGALQYVPFQILTAPDKANPSGSETVIAPAESRSLVLDHEIVNEPSASALAFLIRDTSERKEPSNTIAVFADPVFEADDPRISSATPRTNIVTAQSQESDSQRALRDVGFSGEGRSIPRLQSSRDEADAIMSFTPWWSGFKAVGFDANRATAIKPDLSHYRIVHFATHGLLNDEHPELSGIVLSLFDQKGEPQDGFLRLHDIYNLKLPVDLVVLSACNTGLLRA